MPSEEDILREKLDAEIRGARAAFAACFLQGNGIEVGAGPRPWPVPPAATVTYADRLTDEEIAVYFGRNDFPATTLKIDAQTFDDVDSNSQDFVITAHVIEHLDNPIGAIAAALRILRPGGVYLLAVPDMRFVFDRDRPETTLDHVLADFVDGGAGTRLQACEEHIRYVHPKFAPPIPEDKIAQEVQRLAASGMDLHVHAWTFDGFKTMLQHCETMLPVRLEAGLMTINESVFALRKHLTAPPHTFR